MDLAGVDADFGQNLFQSLELGFVFLHELDIEDRVFYARNSSLRIEESANVGNFLFFAQSDRIELEVEKRRECFQCMNCPRLAFLVDPRSIAECLQQLLQFFEPSAIALRESISLPFVERSIVQRTLQIRFDFSF